MCEPTTLMVLQGISSVMGVVAQQEQASAQEQANQRQYENTMRARAANINQTNLMQQQEREAAMQKLDENNMAARAARSTATASAGDNGITGLSVDALIADLGSKQKRFNSSVSTNYDLASQGIAIQRENVDINAASQINSLKTPAMPDYFGAALRIGKSVYDYQNPNPKIS